MRGCVAALAMLSWTMTCGEVKWKDHKMLVHDKFILGHEGWTVSTSRREQVNVEQQQKDWTTSISAGVSTLKHERRFKQIVVSDELDQSWWFERAPKPIRRRPT